jgi:hypothetical protein
MLLALREKSLSLLGLFNYAEFDNTSVPDPMWVRSEDPDRIRIRNPESGIRKAKITRSAIKKKIKKCHVLKG